MGRSDNRIRTKNLRLGRSCAALGVAAGFVLLAAQGPARAEDPDTNSFYDMTFGRMLEGVGLKKADGNHDINYKERPPLVLPSSRELPPPEKTEAKLSPAWPKDPDVKRRKLQEKQEKDRIVTDEREREQNPLGPNELAPGPQPRGGASISTGPGRSGATDFGEMLSPSELGYKGGMFGKMFRGKDEDVAQFTGEPPRIDLTAPPPGYQTPSPSQPYGVGQSTGKVDNDYMTRGELKR
jgi:hypothetical protein